MVRRGMMTAVLAMLLASPLDGQGLRDAFEQLFRFGDCGDPLCLAGDITQQTGHGDHFIPSAISSSATAIDFITNAIASAVSSTPIPSSSGGAIFEFVGGVPVRTNLSSGPIFGERAETIGRGRVLVGLNTTFSHLERVRGIPMDNLLFNFTHQDTPPEGVRGSPILENDVIQVQTNVDVNVLVTTAFFTVGVSDFMDIGVAVPFVYIDMEGTSVATIVSFTGGQTPLHIFGGTQADPVLVSVAGASETAAGIGDVAGRIKFNFTPDKRVSIGLLGEVRLPTGNEDDLLGAGDLQIKVLGIGSARLGDFTPHVNLGYFSRQAEFQNNVFLATVGFDQLLAPWATLAVDFVSEWQLGDGALGIGDPVTFSEPFSRTINTTIIPDRRDDIASGSVGFKLSPSEVATIIVNAAVPLSNGGVQPTASFTAGFQLNF